MFKPSIIQNPAGTYSFVGSIPYELGYIDTNGIPCNSKLGESQLRLPSKYRSIKCRIFKTIDEAKQAALELGISL